MKILFISDLHCEAKVFRGVYEGYACEWLLSIIDGVKPDALISAGDWGSLVSFNFFQELRRRVPVVLSVYGNHERMDVLLKSGVLMEEGRVHELNGLRIGGIHGIVSPKGGVKKGVPRRTPSEFLSVARRLAGKLDILVMHEVPYLPEAYPDVRRDIGPLTALKAIEIVRPRLVLGGHMHRGCYTIHEVTRNVLYLRVDSSMAERCYVVLEADSIIVYRDEEFVMKRGISLRASP
ncbi:metallophosphoesterase [Pyrolobus fumarii 1A]|uniref:Metallophosphoesterase n=1 Tax=Pyrolobus fumarii (strain DSM 11204 / 1A) TaxID=694429 RepID=G0ED24_PYRF1|nr:metallophosphoesterase [Pyrolobus fumarii]AEM38583.1 metallophosphoesterase [Pyrolobus fumarii 1A]